MSDVDRRLSALRDRFVAGVPARLEKLRAALDRAHDGDRPALEEARRVAHSLHGTAATYRLAALSAGAARVSRTLEAALGSASADSVAELVKAARAATDTLAALDDGASR